MADLRSRVERIIDAHLESLFDRIDKLHINGQRVSDTDMLAALDHLGPVDLRAEYADWADLDVREDDAITTDPVVPDPVDAPSYEALTELANTLRFCIDADCPGCGFPERFLVREIRPDGSPGAAMFGCSKCDYISQERDS